MYTVVALLAALSVGCGRGDVVPASTSVAPESIVMLTSDGEQLRPMLPGKVKVFVFVRTDCPISNRYAPELRRLFKLHSADEVTWWLVYPNPNVTAEDIAKHLAEFEYPCGALHDGDHQLVELTGATITPEVAVYGPTNDLVYCGRIDDRYVDFGRTRAKPTQHDLEDAIQAALAGESVEPFRRQAVGCYIEDLK
jgi:hypothetical protein